MHILYIHKSIQIYVYVYMIIKLIKIQSLFHVTCHRKAPLNGIEHNIHDL